MRRRFYVERVGYGSTLVRTFEEALNLAEQTPGTWRILMRVGSGDETLVRCGVNRAAWTRQCPRLEGRGRELPTHGPTGSLTLMRKLSR